MGIAESISLWLMAVYVGIVVVATVSHLLLSAFKILRRRSRRTEATFGELSTPIAMITIVHGTWAGAGEWTLAESPACKRIQRLFCDKAGFYRFVWSGKNSVTARAEAAARLRDELKSLVSRYPDARHFVIAHSHGGNVVLNALDENLGERLSGIVCLATPVLLTRRRAYPDLAHRPVRLVPGLLFLLVALAVVKYFGDTTPQQNLFIVFIALVLGVVAYQVLRRLQKRADRFSVLQNLDFLPPEKAIFVRATGDEASSGLNAAQFFNWLVGKMTFAPFKLAAAIRQRIDTFRSYIKTKLLIPALAIGSTMILLSLVLEEPFRSLFLVLPIVLAAPFVGESGGGLVGQIVATIMLLPSFLLFPLAGVSIGGEMAILAFATEVFTEPAPPGRWMLLQLSYRKHDEGMRHSDIYEEESCVRAWCDWVLGRYNEEASTKILPIEKRRVSLEESMANLRESLAALQESDRRRALEREVAKPILKRVFEVLLRKWRS